VPFCTEKKSCSAQALLKLASKEKRGIVSICSKKPVSPLLSAPKEGHCLANQQKRRHAISVNKKKGGKGGDAIHLKKTSFIVPRGKKIH